MLGPPMSICSMASSSATSSLAMVRSKGYRFTQTRSMGSMPCSFMDATCPSLSRSPSKPPWTRGCSVLTRPSIISGNPVTSSIGVTSKPASLNALAVPPVEINCTPYLAKDLAKGIRSVLSLTESNARRTGTRSDIHLLRRSS